MVNREKRTAAVCSLVLCAVLCGCGYSGGSEVVAIGRDVSEIAQAAGNRTDGTGAETWGSDASIASHEGQKEAAEIRVYVCGAVEAPGVVTLPEGSRAEDALLAAGGFAETAWRDYVNLAERVSDGQKLYFPTLEEADSLAVEQTSGSGLININTADVAALCTLPGIGESRARDIIAYREANGAFESCEDIMKVSGIKNSVYSKISDRITVK